MSSPSSSSTTAPLRGLGLSPLGENTVKEGGCTSGQAEAGGGGARRGSSPRLELDDEIRPVERGAPSEDEEEARTERPRNVLVDRNGREYDAAALLLVDDEAKGPVRRDSSHSPRDDGSRRNLSPIVSSSHLSVVRDSRSRNTTTTPSSSSSSYHPSHLLVAEGEGDRDPTQIYGKFNGPPSLLV